MKRSKKIWVIASVLVLAFFVGCKNNKQDPKLASLDLLRGELQLCGNGQFGNVNFSEACSYETRETFNLAISLPFL